MKYLHLSIFDGHSKRHGGTRRSEQLRELLEDAGGLSGVTVNPYLGVKAALRFSLRHPITFGSALLFSAKLYATRGLSFRGFLQYAVCSTNLMMVFDQHDFDLVLHETAPGISIPFMQFMAAQGIDFIAIPHNIEYLVPGQVMKAFRSNHRVYQTEIEGYRAARQVLSICDFDTAILRCNSVNAHTLEYRPTRLDRERCMRIRAARAAHESFEGFLLLGTVENKPTFDGTKALLEAMRVIQPELKLTIAGYGTEKFKSYESDKVTVLGSVTDPEVDALLCQTSALLINQPQTTGFLTKVVEMNLSGVPQLIVSDYFQVAGLERFGILKAKIESLHDEKIAGPFQLFPEVNFDVLLRSIESTAPTDTSKSPQ